MNILTGDLFLTRNRLLIHNLTPGFFNHTAIYVGYNLVVEAQVRKGIIHSSLNEFINRYPTLLVVRYKNGDYNDVAGAYARNFVGKYYKKKASLLKVLANDGADNCVSLVRRIFKDITGTDPGWRFPDNIYNDPDIREIYKK